MTNGRRRDASGVSLAGLNAGTYTAAVHATFAGDAANAPSSGDGNLQIATAAVPIAWTSPAPIVYGTPLGATQLNATSGGVPGTFVYTPASGVVLGAGLNQTLSVTFTPTNLTNYRVTTATVAITVTKANVVAQLTTPANPTTGQVTFTSNSDRDRRSDRDRGVPDERDKPRRGGGGRQRWRS